MQLQERDYALDLTDDQIIKLPHNYYGDEFFNGWPRDRIVFYFAMLGRAERLKCRCGETGTKHLMGHMEYNNCLSHMCTERRDWVLQTITSHIKPEAISEKRDKIKASSFLLPWTSWELKEYYPSGRKQRYDWPVEFRMDDYDKSLEKPNFLMYSTEAKKVMIVEVTFKWEPWLNIHKTQEKTKYESVPDKFKNTTVELRKNGFDVKFKCIFISTRGVYCQGLDRFFHEDFEMSTEEEEEVVRLIKEITTDNFERPFQVYKKRFGKSQLDESDDDDDCDDDDDDYSPATSQDTGTSKP